MATIATQLRNKSASLKSGILQLTEELKRTNAEIVALMQSHEAAVANLKAKHEQELAQLLAENEDMTAEVEKNAEFISTIEKLIGE